MDIRDTEINIDDLNLRSPISKKKVWKFVMIIIIVIVVAIAIFALWVWLSGWLEDLWGAPLAYPYEFDSYRNI